MSRKGWQAVRALNKRKRSRKANNGIQLAVGIGVVIVDDAVPPQKPKTVKRPAHFVGSTK